MYPSLTVAFLWRRFAFLDFRTPQLATAALTDPRNFSIDGRDLKLEFASADAVRRSGLQPKPEGGKGKGKGGGPRQHKKRDGEAQVEVEEGEDDQPATKRTKYTKEGSGKHHRLRPGAALAGAPREQPSIVPSEGKKIKF